jgi:hypothetical protein
MTRKIGMLIALLLFITAPGAIQAQQPQTPVVRTPFGEIQKPGPATTNPSEIQKVLQAAPSSSDDAAPSIFYRLEFTIRELDREKLVDTRSYTLSVQSGVYENLMAGSEVPYPSSAYTSGSSSTKNLSYRNIGVSIGCTVKELNDSPRLDLKLEISDSLPPAKDSDAPVFRKIVLNCRSLLVLGKPTTVGVVEDPGSRHRFQVEATATKLK